MLIKEGKKFMQISTKKELDLIVVNIWLIDVESDDRYNTNTKFEWARKAHDNRLLPKQIFLLLQVI